MNKHMKVRIEDHKDFKVIAAERGMTILGLFRYVVKALKENRI
jgi:hypothetical protein